MIAPTRVEPCACALARPRRAPPRRGTWLLLVAAVGAFALGGLAALAVADVARAALLTSAIAPPHLELPEARSRGPQRQPEEGAIRPAPHFVRPQPEPAPDPFGYR